MVPMAHVTDLGLTALVGRRWPLQHRVMAMNEENLRATTDYSGNRHDESVRTATPTWIAERDRDRLIMFTHVPKTGGTTLKQILTINYGRFFADHHPRIQNLNDEIESGTRDPLDLLAISSHLPYGVHRTIPGIEDRILLPMTVVREPKKRIISYYNFVTTFRAHRLHAATKDLDINEFFARGLEDGWGEISNSQCRLVHGGSLRTFEAARKTLENDYFAYSALEDIGELITRVGELLGWPPAGGEERRANQSPKKQGWDDLEPDIAAELELRNAGDIELHELLAGCGPVIREEMLTETADERNARQHRSTSTTADDEFQAG